MDEGGASSPNTFECAHLRPREVCDLDLRKPQILLIVMGNLVQVVSPNTLPSPADVTGARTQRELEVQRVGYLLKVLPLAVLICAAFIISSATQHLLTFVVCAVFLAQNITANRIGSLVSRERAHIVDGCRYALNAVVIFVLTLIAGKQASPWLLALPPIAGAPVYFARSLPTMVAQLGLAVAACAGLFFVTGELLPMVVPGIALVVAASLSTSITVYLSGTSERLFNALQRVEQEVRHRERVEQELRTMHAELEQRVEERTQALSREVTERQRAEQRAIEASQVKSQFLANMSHELRTPLNAVLGYAELIGEEDDALAAQTRNDLAKIHASASHLLNLIQDILDLSKVEAGKMEVDLDAIDVAKLMASVEATASPLAANNNNKLVCTYEPDIGLIKSDPIRIKQILLNLLSNACKFTRDGTIELRARRYQEDGVSMVEFVIADTGIGIAPQTIDRLFKPFLQADISITRKFGGTGLGLAISLRLARLLGGSITVESELDRGSVFTVKLRADMSQLAVGMAS